MPPRAGRSGPRLLRDAHARYLYRSLRSLPASYAALDCSRPFLCYWAVHALRLLDEPLDDDASNKCVDTVALAPCRASTCSPSCPYALIRRCGCGCGNSIVALLRRCQHPHGGFGGGPGQMPHLVRRSPAVRFSDASSQRSSRTATAADAAASQVPTFAAIHTLVSLGTADALDSVDRRALYDFLHRMRQPDGSFRMHDDGEVGRWHGLPGRAFPPRCRAGAADVSCRRQIDVRGAYCAASVAHLMHIDTPTLFAGTAEWIAACQTYEGGIAGVPGMEAHGGYSYCGLAALLLLQREQLLDLPALLRWAVHRQMRTEGGFQGRTNKLVDSCYSFWQGAIVPLLRALPQFRSGPHASTLLQDGLFDQGVLRPLRPMVCLRACMCDPHRPSVWLRHAAAKADT